MKGEKKIVVKSVTNAIIAYKIDELAKTVDKMAATFETHVKDDARMALDVHDLKGAQETRKRHLWVIYPAILGLLAAYIKNLF